MAKLKVEGRLTQELVDELRNAVADLSGVRIDMALAKLRHAKRADDAEAYLREQERIRVEQEQRAFENDSLHNAYMRLKEKGIRKKVF